MSITETVKDRGIKFNFENSAPLDRNVQSCSNDIEQNIVSQVLENCSGLAVVCSGWQDFYVSSMFEMVFFTRFRSFKLPLIFSHSDLEPQQTCIHSSWKNIGIYCY